MRFALLIPASLLVGCNTSGLYSAAALEQLYDVSPVPEAPAWELRWLGQDGGLDLGCALIPISDFAPELIGGTIQAAPPDEVGAPQLWNDAGTHRWAAAVLVLVNPDLYDPAHHAEEDDGESDELAELEADDGIWGGVEDRALLFAEGDTAAIADSLVVGDGSTLDFEALADEGQWVGVVPELVSQLGTLAGAMYPLSGAERDALDAGGLSVTANERISAVAYGMLSGESLGGVRWGCAQ